MFYINFKNNNLNNDGNKGKYRVKMCYFCNEEDQSNNKNFNNNIVTHESCDNNFKNNNLNSEGNKGKYIVQISNEEGHKKYNCP